MPGMGERWASANPRLVGLQLSRIEGFENHLIFYRVTNGGVDVVRIVH